MTVAYAGHTYSLESTSLNTSIPEGYTLGQLKPEHAYYVLKMYGNPLQELPEFVSKLLTKFPGVALYNLLDNSFGMLIIEMILS